MWWPTRVLCEAGADLDSQWRPPLLLTDAERRNIAAMEVLLEAGANPDGISTWCQARE